MQRKGFEARAGLVGVALAAAASLLAPALADAVIRHAEPNGNGPEPCLASDPCDIQVAVEAAPVNPGDEVILAPGDYLLTAALDEVDVTDAIMLHGQAGQPRPRLVASGATSTVLFSDQAATVISHIEIEQGSGNFGLFLSAGTAEDMIVRSTVSATACAGTNGKIRDSVCWSSGASGSAFAINSSGGMGTVTLRNVTAVSSSPASSYGIFLDMSGGGMVTIDAKSVIADGTTADVHASEAVGSDATINLDHSNYATVTTGAGAPIVTPAGTGTNQTALPLFVDAASGNFHQAPGSPTINNGAVDVSSGLLDFDGETRSFGTAPDIGADEFVDTDGDGIADTSDGCPLVAAATSNGCPITVTPLVPVTPLATAPTGQRAAALKKCAKIKVKRKKKKCKKRAMSLPV